MGGDNSKLKVPPSLRSCAAAGVTQALSEDFRVGTLEPPGLSSIELEKSPFFQEITGVQLGQEQQEQAACRGTAFVLWGPGLCSSGREVWKRVYRSRGTFC